MKNIRKYIFGFLVFVLIGFCASAQPSGQISFRRYTTEWTKIEKGMSQNTVFAVLQDSDGFIWIGTWDGLNKFDGYSFEIFRPNAAQPEKSISNETVKTLYEDEDGLLWIGTEGGLSVLNRYNYHFTHYLHNPNVKFSISSDTIYAISGNKNGAVFVATHRGLNIYDKSTKAFSHLLKIPVDDNCDICPIINCMYYDKKAFLWLGTFRGLYRYDLITGAFDMFRSNDNLGLLSDTILSITKDAEGILWVGTDKGISLLDSNQKWHKTYTHQPHNPNSLSNNIVSSILHDKRGNTWIATYGSGLDLLMKEKEQFVNYKNVYGKSNSISHDYLRMILEDDFGNIWIAAWKGLNRLDLNAKVFEHYHYVPDKKHTLNSNTVWAFYEENDELWIGTENGINILNRTNGTYKYIVSDVHNSNTLSSNQIRVIKRDSKGYYWIGTTDGGLNKYDRANNKFTHYKHDPKNTATLPDNQVWTVVEDHNGNIWAGSFGGLSLYNRENGTFKNYTHNPDDANSLCYNMIMEIFVDSKNRLWVSTYNGLSMLDAERKIFTNFKNDKNNPNSLSNNRVFSVTQDRDGNFWIATMGGGLNYYNESENYFKAYTEQEGIANNIVYKALQDNKGDLWITTNYGLSYFNKENETFINYDISDGIQSSEFNGGAAFKTNKGEIIAGGMNGFNIFFPDDFIVNEYNPNVVITQFKIFDNLIPVQLKRDDTIRLSYKENFISFEFASLDFTNAEKNKYAFKLEGFDRDWSYSDASRRIAEYTNIPPGNYIFRVRGTNSYGTWSDKEIAILLIIKPAWYKTWVFRILMALLILGVAALLLYDRYQKVRKKHRWDKQMLAYEKQVFNLRQKALSLQMNPHFIFNTLNAIQNFILKDNTDQAIKYMGKLSQLMRLILSSTRDIYAPVINEIKALTHYLDLEKIRFDNKFDYVIQLDKDIDSEFMAIPPMIIQPFVENALLHGILHKHDKGLINIELKLSNRNIICVVEDDGVGRELAAKIKKESGLMHRSKGITITKERLSLFEKYGEGNERIIFEDLKNTDGKAVGTKVIIVLPFTEV